MLARKRCAVALHMRGNVFRDVVSQCDLDMVILTFDRIEPGLKGDWVERRVDRHFGLLVA